LGVNYVERHKMICRYCLDNAFMFLFQFASHLDWTNEPHLNLTMRKAPSYVVICSFIWRKVRIWSELMSMMKTQTGPSAMHAFIAKEGNNKWFKWFKQGREIPTCFSFSSNEAQTKTQDALFSYCSSVIQTAVILYSCVVGVLDSPGGVGGGILSCKVQVCAGKSDTEMVRLADPGCLRPPGS